MRFRTALCLATLLHTCFTVAAWSAPVPDRLAPSDPQPTPENQSLSGKIASINDAAFALEVAEGKDVNIVKFLVDDDTKVEGKLGCRRESHRGISFGCRQQHCCTRRRSPKIKNELVLTNRSGFFQAGSKQFRFSWRRPLPSPSRHISIRPLRSLDAHDSENRPALDRERRRSVFVFCRISGAHGKTCPSQRPFAPRGNSRRKPSRKHRTAA